MNSQVDPSLPYPGGHVKYAFDMHVDHDMPIFCDVPHQRVEQISFEKHKPTDELDPHWLMTIRSGPVYSIDDVHEIGNMIKDDILDILSFTLNTKISEVSLVSHGLTPRPGEGFIAHFLEPSCQMHATLKVDVPKLNSETIQQFRMNLSELPNLQCKYLISLFRHAISTDEPVVQFMMLYLILIEIYIKQATVDEYIMKAAPTTWCEPSPHNGKPETIYTKLRNQITHRANIGPEATRAEIVNHLNEFRRIAHRAVRSKI